MRPLCLLIAGTDLYFDEQLDPFDAYLQSIGCQTIRLDITTHNIVATLKNAVRVASDRRPLMIAYSGHGSWLGWECGIFYLSLAYVLGRYRGDLVILNDTCHGFSLRHYLRLFRNPKVTGLIVHWDGDGPMYGGTFKDALRYWPKSTIVENEISEHIYSSGETGDIQVPIQLRWGTVLDHLFFPDPSP